MRFSDSARRCGGYGALASELSTVWKNRSRDRRTFGLGFRECVNCSRNGCKSVAPSWRESSFEVEELKGIGVGGGDLERRRAVEEVREQGHEPANNGRIGVRAEVAPSIRNLRDQPDA